MGFRSVTGKYKLIQYSKLPLGKKRCGSEDPTKGACKEGGYGSEKAAADRISSTLTSVPAGKGGNAVGIADPARPTCWYVLHLSFPLSLFSVTKYFYTS